MAHLLIKPVRFLSTPSARRATLLPSMAARARAISIHALREEGDFADSAFSASSFAISIHALREEGDLQTLLFLHHLLQFLSTPSARRATLVNVLLHRRAEISIHALREEGDPHQRGCGRRPPISIHALREEGDRQFRPLLRSFLHFYPRPPRGGRLVLFQQLIQIGQISIHALREEGDDPKMPSKQKERNFYPRPPRGGRR